MLITSGRRQQHFIVAKYTKYMEVQKTYSKEKPFPAKCFLGFTINFAIKKAPEIYFSRTIFLIYIVSFDIFVRNFLNNYFSFFAFVINNNN